MHGMKDNLPKHSKESTEKEPLLAVILRFCVYALACIPLVIFQDYFSPFHFGKAVVLRSLVDLMMIGYVFLVIRDRSYLPRVNSIFLSVILFGIAYAFTSFTSYDVDSSIWGSLERMGGLYSFVHIILFFVIMSGVLRTWNHWKVMLQITAIVSLLSSCYGFLQKTSWDWVLGSGGRTKIFGTLGNPALFAGYVLVAGFLSLGLALSEWKKGALVRYLWLGIFLVNAIAVLMSGVRGSVVGLIVATFITGIAFAYITRHTVVIRSVIAAFVVLGAIVAALIVFKDSDFVKNSQYLARYSDFSPQSYTIQTRTWTWTSGLKGWFNDPRAMLIGFGPENFYIPFLQYFNPMHFRGPGSETLFDRAHNMPLEILITMGLIGFIIYVLMFASVLQHMIQMFFSAKPSRSAHISDPYIVWPVILVAIIAGYSIHNFFIFDTTANYVVIFTAIAFATFLVSEKMNISFKKGEMADTSIAVLAAISVGITACFSIYLWNIKPAQANYTMTRGAIANYQNDTKQAFKLMEQAVSMGTPISFDLGAKFAQALMERYSGGEISQEGLVALQYMLKTYKQFSDERPYDNTSALYTARMAVILGRIKGNEKMNDVALALVQRAIDISPAFVRTYFELGQVYLNQSDPEKALAAFQKAADLAPQAPIGYWYVGNVLLELKRKDEAIKMIQKAVEGGYAPSKSDYIRLAGLFVKVNDIKNATTIYTSLVKSSPNDPQLRATLAAAYAQIGMIDKAVEQAREIVRIDPSLKPDAEAFLKTIGRTL